MVSRDNYPNMDELFRLVNYYGFTQINDIYIYIYNISTWSLVSFTPIVLDIRWPFQKVIQYIMIFPMDNDIMIYMSNDGDL